MMDGMLAHHCISDEGRSDRESLTRSGIERLSLEIGRGSGSESWKLCCGVRHGVCQAVLDTLKGTRFEGWGGRDAETQSHLEHAAAAQGRTECEFGHQSEGCMWQDAMGFIDRAGPLCSVLHHSNGLKQP